MAMDELRLSWDDVEAAVDKIVEQVSELHWDTVVAIMRGGLVPARMVAAKLGVDNIVVWDRNCGMLGKVRGSILIVDDIADTGVTAAEARFTFGAPMAVLVAKTDVGCAGMKLEPPKDKAWVVFPWEGSGDRVNERQSR